MIRPIHAKMATLFLPPLPPWPPPLWPPGAGRRPPPWPLPPWRRWRSREVSTSSSSSSSGSASYRLPKMSSDAWATCEAKSSAPPAWASAAAWKAAQRQSPCPRRWGLPQRPLRARQTRPSQRRRRSGPARQSPGCHIPGRQSRPAGQSPLHRGGQSPPRSRAAPARQAALRAGPQARAVRAGQSAGPAGQNRTARGPSVPPRWCPAWAAAPPRGNVPCRGGGRRLLRHSGPGLGRGVDILWWPRCLPGCLSPRCPKAASRQGPPWGPRPARAPPARARGPPRGACAKAGLRSSQWAWPGCAWASGPPGSGGPPPAGAAAAGCCGAAACCGAAGRASGCGAGSSSKVISCTRGSGAPGTPTVSSGISTGALAASGPAGWAAPSACGPNTSPNTISPIFFCGGGGLAAHRLKQLRHTGRARLRGAGLLVEEVRASARRQRRRPNCRHRHCRAPGHSSPGPGQSLPQKEIIIRHKKHRLFQYQSFLLARKLRPKAWRNYLLYYNKSALSASFSGKLCPHARAAHPFFPKKALQFFALWCMMN